MARQFATTALVLCTLQQLALAQSTPSDVSIKTFDPEEGTAPIQLVEGSGWKIREGTSLHPIVGIQTGVVSNVFYEAAGANASGILRFLAQAGIGSLSGLRLVPSEAASENNVERKGEFEYRADVRLAYDLFLSGNEVVRGSGGLGAGATLRGMTNPGGTWSFGFNDNFTRYIRAANFETDANTNRNINTLTLNVLFHPPGRTLAGNLYYSNTIDYFERNEQRFANRQLHRIGVRPMWRWLPQTVLYSDLSWGVTAGLGDSAGKVTSYPLQAVAGAATLLSAKTTLNVQGGYANGFYTSGPSYSSATVGTSVGYRYSPLGRISAGYDLLYQDSVNANFFRDHVVRLNVEQLFAPFMFMVQPELHFRRYEGIAIVMGPPTRDDLIFSVIAGLHYNFRNSLAATIDYHFSMVSTDYSYTVDGMADDPGFARHNLLAGLSWAL